MKTKSPSTSKKKLISTIQQLVADNVKIQDDLRGVIDQVIQKIQQALEDGQIGVERQLQFLEGLAACSNHIGKANETNLKAASVLVNAANGDDDADEDVSESADDILRAISGKTKR